MNIAKLKQPMQLLATLPQQMIHLFQILLAACFMSLCAQIEIPLYFTPVPFTVQTTAVMLIAACLGSRKGVYAILCYLAQGCMGLPVWAGGAAGLIHFFGPTGGYLMAFVLQVSFIGWFIKKSDTVSFINVPSILLLSICFQLAIGSLWLAQFVGIEKCLVLGFYPFLVSEFAKAILTALFINHMKSKR